MNRHQKYRQSPKGQKNQAYNNWKKRGLNMEDFDNIYDRYVNTECCDICKCSFENNIKCMEHNHKTGEFRGVVCVMCNHNMNDNNYKLSKSGHRYISYHKRDKVWFFQRNFYGKKYQKPFKNKTDALCYKYIMLLKFSILKKNKYNNI